MVPGMQHCSDDVRGAPWYFAGVNQRGALGTCVASVLGSADAQHDILLALMSWVEDGTAPDEIIATSYVNNTISLSVNRQRPLCVYLKKSTYVSGDSNLPESFCLRLRILGVLKVWKFEQSSERQERLISMFISLSELV